MRRTSPAPGGARARRKARLPVGHVFRSAALTRRPRSLGRGYCSRTGPPARQREENKRKRAEISGRAVRRPARCRRAAGSRGDTACRRAAGRRRGRIAQGGGSPAFARSSASSRAASSAGRSSQSTWARTRMAARGGPVSQHGEREQQERNAPQHLTTLPSVHAPLPCSAGLIMRQAGGGGKSKAAARQQPAVGSGGWREKRGAGCARRWACSGDL